MITDTHKTTQRLVAGRAGELTHRANAITFDLLEKVFGEKGPYRNVLKRFGVKIRNGGGSFLVLNEGVVYTDLDKEQDMLWGVYPIVLTETSGEISHVFSWKKANPYTLFNYACKTVTDAILVVNVWNYLKKSRRMYKNISLEVEHICQNKSISLKDFFRIYEEIIYVSYLFEFLFLYNKNTPSNNLVRHFVEKNDYLVANNTRYLEFELKLPGGFFLDDYVDLDKKLEYTSKLDFIPGQINLFPKNSGLTPVQKAEKELQCLKDNLRLKTNILLFFLNLSALSNAKVKGMLSIGDKKLAQIF